MVATGETLSGSEMVRCRTLPRTVVRWTMVAMLAVLTGAGERAASQPAQAPKPQPTGAPTQPSQPAVTSQKLPVSVEQALYLIRSTLLTLNDANRSGNYTVLRDLAAAGFQARNTAADLGVIFADLRRRRFDLFSVALMAPQLTAQPALDVNRMLRLTGVFPSRPQQIKFDLLFENAGGQWRLFGIAVDTPDAPPLPQTSGRFR